MTAKASVEAEETKRPQLPVELIRVAEIKAVRLERLTAQSSVRSRRDVKKPHIAVNFRTTAKGFAEGRFRIEGRIEAILSDAARPEQSPGVIIRAVYELEYEFPKQITPSEQELEVFADTNAVLNVWPYWREIVQHLSMRLDLPPIVLPLFRLGKGPTRSRKRTRSTKR